MDRHLSRCAGFFVAAVLLVFPGCQNYRHALQRGQGYYEQNHYEMALAVWRDLERDTDSLSRDDMVRYCYLRGMTDYRLGYRRDARYWLGLSKASQDQARAALQDDEKMRLDRTLADLNQDVFGSEQPGASAQEMGDACKWTSDCERGFICKEGACVIVEESNSSLPAAPGPRDEEGASEVP